MSHQLLLIDGSAYIFRAYFALPPMTRGDGTPVNAVFGFTSMVMKLLDDLKPDHVVVVLDQARKTFRNDIYPDYKANRSEAPEDLIPQFPLIRVAAEALSLPVAELEGFEADDLIATYAQEAEGKELDVVIVSSDKDLMQLIRPHVSMLDPMKQKRIGADEVLEKFGVQPDKVVDVQSLAGDSTDNVPGVPGIGVKTAAELINTFGDLDSLLARAEEIKQPKRRESLITYAEQARISRQLVTLRDDVPLPIGLDGLARQPYDMDKLLGFLKEQEFSRLISRISSEHNGQPPTASPPASATDNASAPVTAADSVEANYELITTPEQLKNWVSRIADAGIMAVDTETTSLRSSAALLVGIAIATAPGVAAYIPIRHRGGAAKDQGQLDFDLGSDDVSPDTETNSGMTLLPDQMVLDDVMAILKPVLEAAHILKIGHNLKYDDHIFSRQINGSARLHPVDDTMCLSFVLDAGTGIGHKLDDLAAHHLGHNMISYTDICGKGTKKRRFDEVSPDEALTYAAEDADMTLRLWQMLKPRLATEHKTRVYERLERPLIPVLVDMEVAGIKVDAARLASISHEFAERLHTLEQQIHAMAGSPFNIGSPKQLGEILFDKMELQGGKKSKTGAWSTGADILEDLAASGVEIAEKVLDWRQLAKLKSTYADALVSAIHPDSRRVHTSFSMVGASTGRLSSSDPNIQNIPIRTPEGRRIRTAFVAESDHKLISADYSQIELRLVAHIAKEESMINAFRQGVDIHAQTASEVFNIPLDQMTSETRRRAKAINFGIIYGISAFGLGRQLHVPQREARDYINAYFERFPGIKTYMDETKLAAHEQGFVETLFGRRLYINGIKSSNQAQRGFAERQAINAPIQGTAADIIKQAMIRMPGAISDSGLPARMLLQVHDELIFECPSETADDVMALITGVMEKAAEPTVNISVPLVVEASSGLSWDEVH
ncbi:MAG: DNA polymerase I [Alphaproteobacteria bacterium]|nr:DNA polymerase I [Alphaproteobacteria bacterium]